VVLSSKINCGFTLAEDIPVIDVALGFDLRAEKVFMFVDMRLGIQSAKWKLTVIGGFKAQEVSSSICGHHQPCGCYFHRSWRLSLKSFYGRSNPFINSKRDFDIILLDLI